MSNYSRMARQPRKRYFTLQLFYHCYRIFPHKVKAFLQSSIPRDVLHNSAVIFLASSGPTIELLNTIKVILLSVDLGLSIKLRTPLIIKRYTHTPDTLTVGIGQSYNLTYRKREYVSM